MSDATLLTAAELERCRAQLLELRRIRDHDLPDLLRTARELVAADATEERMQVLDDFAAVERRIARLERFLGDAQVVDDGEHGADCVVPGRTVTLRYAGSGREVRYVVGWAGSDTGGMRAVSVGSPVGRAIVGACVGDVVSAELPDGRTVDLLIVAVAPAAG